MAAWRRHVAVAVTAALATGPAPAADGELPAESLREFSQAYGIIRKHYVDKVDDAKLLQDAIRGMLDGLDPHSTYIAKTELEAFNNSLQGNFGGVGIYIDIDRGIIRVVAPIDETPASRAGLEANDFVVRIDGESTEGMEIAEAASRMRGVPGTTVTLDIVRLKEETREDFQVPLVREVIHSPSVRSALAGDGVGFMRITQFLRPDRTPAEVAKHLDRLYAANGGKLDGLVLDLRNNPGGDLTSSICVASMFLAKGKVIVTDQGRDKVNQEHVSDLLHCQAPASIAKSRTIDIAVLVNNGSASASEILAGALQDHDRGIIIGTNTFGKASVQRIYNLEATAYRSALKLTSARYYTPSGRSIHDVGIIPDVELKYEPPAEVLAAEDTDGEADEEETVSEAELSNLREIERKEDQVLPNDNQFHRAMAILRERAG